MISQIPVQKPAAPRTLFTGIPAFFNSGGAQDLGAPAAPKSRHFRPFPAISKTVPAASPHPAAGDGATVGMKRTNGILLQERSEILTGGVARIPLFWTGYGRPYLTIFGPK